MAREDHRLPEGLTREQKLGRTFVDLAETLVATFDLQDFLQLLCQRTQDILEVQAVGVLVETERGALAVVGASSVAAQALDLFELQARQGPCYEAYTQARQIVSKQLADDKDRWPEFVPRALAAGYAAVYAFPLRLREQCIGAMNLFRTTAGSFEDADVDTAQALADLAMIGLLANRRIADAELRADQLQYALESRVVIEQAKGVIAERHGVDPREAFELLRYHARPTNRRIHEVAQEVIDGELEL